jgi:hypothetical protein
LSTNVWCFDGDRGHGSLDRVTRVNPVATDLTPRRNSRAGGSRPCLPTELRGDVLQDALDHVRVVVHS